ncbi:MAG: 50S ribosomal protein L18 [Patescibacteria group bacterium]
MEKIRKTRGKKRSSLKTKGTKKRPRLSVFRSNKYVYGQLIDDEKGVTLISASDKNIKRKPKKAMTKVELASFVGEEIAKRAKAKKITRVIFDRGRYKYHGRVKKLAEGARKGGLKF